MVPFNALPSYMGCLLDRCLPGCTAILKRKWTPLDLINLSGKCVDAAFLNAVHVYKRVLGSKYFPSGVFHWPATEWADKYHARKVMWKSPTPAEIIADGRGRRSDEAEADEPHGGSSSSRDCPGQAARRPAGEAGHGSQPAAKRLRCKTGDSTRSVEPTRTASDAAMNLHSKWGSDTAR